MGVYLHGQATVDAYIEAGRKARARLLAHFTKAFGGDAARAEEVLEAFCATRIARIEQENPDLCSDAPQPA